MLEYIKQNYPEIEIDDSIINLSQGSIGKALKLNENKTAETLIKYVEKQIDLMYSKKPPCPDLVYKVTEDGKLLARVDCGNKPKFIVDVTNGTLTSETIGKPTSEYRLSEVDGIDTSSTGEGQ